MPSEIDVLAVSQSALFRKNGSPLNELPLIAAQQISDLLGWNVWASDFLQYTGPNTAGESGGWLLTETAAGVGNAQRVDIDDSMTHGYLKLLTDNGASDVEILEMTGEPWRWVLGKRLFCFLKLRVDDITKTTLFAGLAIADTSPLGGVTDGIYFRKAVAAAANLAFVTEKNSNETEIDLWTMVNATDVIVGFYVDGSGIIHVYAGTSIATLQNVANVVASNANIPDDEDLHITLSVMTSEAVAHSMSLDWLFVAQER